MPTTVTFSRLPILALFLTLVPATMAGHTWYVDGVNGTYNNNCFGTLTVIDSVITNNKIGGPGFLGYGGAIYNCPFSTLTLINKTISDNSAEVGGAICNGGLRTIVNSTFSGNVARNHRGGAIANYGTLLITNSTFNENSSGSSGQGGGILNGGLFQSSGTLFINNSTFSGNIAGEGRGAASST